MVQTTVGDIPKAAMVSSLYSISSDGVSVSSLGLLEDGNVLYAPVQDGRKIVLDLTPEEDDWLTILNDSNAAMPHQDGHDTLSLHMAVKLSPADCSKLDDLEKQIQKAHGYSVLRNNGKTWYTMRRGDDKVILNLVLENSQSLTPLRFIQDGKIKKGFGKKFLDDCLAGSVLRDFQCKAKVELECVQETSDSISVTLTVHSVVFAPMPKRIIVDLTTDEEEMMIRASKRLKYRF